MDNAAPRSHEATSEKSHGPDDGQKTRAELKKIKAQQKLHKFETKVYNFTDPINRLGVSAGAESFHPQSLGEECQKAARIITSLSSYLPPRNVEPDSYETYPPHQPFMTIPPSAVKSAKAVLVLTTLRLGFGKMAVSTGSGLIISRRPDGSNAWGLPSAVKLHSIGGGPIALGVGVTDRVYLINDQKTLEYLAGKKSKDAKCYVLDAEGLVALGGMGGGGGLTYILPCQQKEKKGWWRKRSEHHVDTKEDLTRVSTENQSPVENEKNTPIAHPSGKKGEMKESLKHPVYCYSRCRGLYAGFQAQGAALLHRLDANAAFYGVEGLTPRQLLLPGLETHAGEAPVPMPEEGPWSDTVGILVAALERASRIPPTKVEEPNHDVEKVDVVRDEVGSQS